MIMLRTKITPICGRTSSARMFIHMCLLMATITCFASVGYFFGRVLGSLDEPSIVTDFPQQQQQQQTERYLRRVQPPIPFIHASTPYYLQGKSYTLTQEARHRENFHSRTQEIFYRRLLAEPLAEIRHNTTLWALPKQLEHPTRNHEAVVLEYDDKQTLVIILGRYSRAVQWIDLHTGELNHRVTNQIDPAGKALNDLNHVGAVVIDNAQTRKKEIWIPCGFHNDPVGSEISSQYVRIINVDTMEISAGPRLPYAGGACAASAVEIVPNEPLQICTFGGTHGNHDTGSFLSYTSCYDQLRQRWQFPFGSKLQHIDNVSTYLLLYLVLTSPEYISLVMNRVALGA